jgi:hypothetical protein
MKLQDTAISTVAGPYFGECLSKPTKVFYCTDKIGPLLSSGTRGSEVDYCQDCGRRHSERYDNTSLFTVTYQGLYMY